MSGKKNIAVVTGSRAEYGLLRGLIEEISKESSFNLQLMVTGMHLAKEFGMTVHEIERDGFPITKRVPMLSSDDTNVGITKSIGQGVIGFADALSETNPDLVVLLGDRFEILAAAQAAVIARTPIAHLCGGDTTEGAFDESIRHSITKMAHLHFVTNEKSRTRVLQMGENPKYVFNVGSLSIDNIHKLKALSRDELTKDLKYEWKKRNLLVTFHPETLGKIEPTAQMETLLHSLQKLLDKNGDKLGLIFTYPNADTQGRKLISMIDSFTEKNKTAKAYASLGTQRYLSTMKHVDAVIGNSSSGIYETPSFHKPTINIGNRQKGRLMAGSVLNVSFDSKAIFEAIENALELDCSDVENPYGGGNTAIQIKNILKDLNHPEKLITKKFFERINP